MAARTGTARVVTTTRKYKDQVYRTHLLQRSYREAGAVKNETLGNRSHIEDLDQHRGVLVAQPRRGRSGSWIWNALSSRARPGAATSFACDSRLKAGDSYDHSPFRTRYPSRRRSARRRRLRHDGYGEHGLDEQRHDGAAVRQERGAAKCKHRNGHGPGRARRQRPQVDGDVLGPDGP